MVDVLNLFTSEYEFIMKQETFIAMKLPASPEVLVRMKQL